MSWNASKNKPTLRIVRFAEEDSPLELSVVMPCLNEAPTLAKCIDDAQRALAENHIHGEVVIADNGSTDGSQQIALSRGARVVVVSEKGYGSALLGGFAAARGEYIVMGDADDSYNFGDIPRFLEPLRQGYDLVMGNRFQGGIAPGAMPPLHRYLGNPVLSGLGRLLFCSPCRDFHCGLRGFRKEALTTLDLQTSGMELASEMIVKATLFGLRITEVPTTLSPDGRNRPPHLRSWRDGWRHLRFMLVHSPRWLFLYPGLALMSMSATAMGWLLYGPRMAESSLLDLPALVGASLGLIVGFQGVSFAVLSKVHAMTVGIAPWKPALRRVLRYVTLETGIIAGGALLCGGMIGLALAADGWDWDSREPIDLRASGQWMIPAVAMAWGYQTILSSFVLSLLGMNRKPAISSQPVEMTAASSRRAA